jgi:nitrite reductase (cytochrome c-552)
MKKFLVIILVFLTAIGFLALANNMGSSDAIASAEDWKDEYSIIYQSYMANYEMNKTRYGGSEPIDYLGEYPNLMIFYDGYGFSKEYLRARGHVYAMEDVLNTARPKAGASCLSCKTADFTEALAKGGVEVNTMDFQQFVDENPEMNTISCYDCHRNTPGVINLTRAHLTKTMEDNEETINTKNLACAQCHVEYYQQAETKEVILPWKYGYDTESILKYYDEINFKDWVHPKTGAELLKAQHPEFETYYESPHYNSGLTCIDCHMPEIEGEDNLKSHHWTSPLKSEEGLSSTCITCHGGEPEDRIADVEEVQKSVYDKTNEVSDELAEFISRLAKAVKDGDMKEEDLAGLRDIHRRAQFKWDFVFVENSEGFHNSFAAHKNLDDARELIKEGIKILEENNK